MKKYNLEQFAREIKRSLNRKVKYSRSLLFLVLLNGFCVTSNYSYASDLWIEYKGDLHGSGNDLNEGSGVWNSNKDIVDPKHTEATILSSGSNRAGSATGLRNKDFLRTVAIGSRAVAGGSDSTSIGYRAIVGKNNSSINVGNSHQGTAVGYRTFAYGNEATSIGNDTVAYGESSISIGSDNIGYASGNNPYARKALSYDIWELFYKNGEKFNYTDEYSTVIGHGQNTSEYKRLYNEYLKLNSDPKKPNWKTHNWAFGDSSIAIGSRNVAYGHSSVSLGTASIAKGNFSTALGTGTLAFGDSSVALGNEVYIYSNQSTGVGNNVQALVKGSMVYGLNSYSGGEGSIAIGTRALANVKIKGTHNNLVGGSIEKVDLEELYNGDSNDNQDKTIKKLAKLDQNRENLYNAQTELQKGTGENKAIKNDANGAVAIGYFVVASGENSLAFGRQAYSKGKSSISIGPYAYAKEENSVSLGYGAKALNVNSFSIGSYSRSEGKNSIALGVEAKVLNDDSNNSINGENSLALGNESEVKMRNSVALGYKSTTNYYYNDSNPTTHTLSGKDAIKLGPYIPEGSSYNLKTDEAAGIISVGWNNNNNNNNNIGLRRIVGVAPGALDSDVATVGQLKALQYVNKEGLVVYYTEEDGKNVKLVKADDGKFYRRNNLNGEPLKDLNDVPKDKVLVGAKGANEQEFDKNSQKFVDIGEKIRFGHLQDALIKSDSDQAVTGAQLNSVKDVLGVSLNSDNTKFKRPSFNAIEYEGSTKNTKNTFKEALNETITAINKGYKFSDGINNGTQFLGSTVEIINGDINNNYKAENLETKFEKNGSKATFKIGLKDNPTFKKVTITETPTEKKDAINKEYLDIQLENVAANFTVSGNAGSGYDINKQNNQLAIKGKVGNNNHKNITTTTKINPSKELEIELNSNLKDITSIGKDDNNKILFNSNSATIKLGNVDLNLTKEGNKVKVSNVADGKNNNDAVNVKQLNEQKIHYVSINGNEQNESSNYDNKGAKANKAIAIGVGASVDVPNSVVIGSNINVTQGNDEKNEKDAVIAIGSGVKLNNAKSSIVMGTVYEGPNNDARTTLENSEWTVAIGNKTQVSNSNDAVAIGNNINVNNAGGSVVLGNRASATVRDGIALGSHSVANKSGDIKGLDTVTGLERNDNNYGAWKSKHGALSIGKPNETRQITGLAAGKEDTDAVNVAQLKNATMHYISIKYPSSNNGNYANDGATKEGAIAIGVGAKAHAEKALSLGYGTDIKSTAKESIAIGVSGSPTTIENAEWAVAIGNKTSITGGNDIVALGSNIAITGTNNGSVVAIGNGAKASTAKDSIVIGKGAESKATNAVALGSGAYVDTNAGDSIALGNASKALTKKTSHQGAEISANSNSIKFSWNNAGTGADKSVLSIGDTNKERVITNVAAGDVIEGSTDAINGGQLYSVAQVFSKLGVDVLGADKADNKEGFKQSTFAKLKDKTGNDNNVIAPTTFKEAIDKNIAKLNEGLKFNADSKGTDSNDKTHYLGSTVSIVRMGQATTTSDEYKGDNLITKYTYENGNAKIEIGLKDKPEFKQIKVTELATKDTDVINKSYLDSKLSSLANKFKVNSDSGKTTDIDKELVIKGKQENTYKNISTEVSSNQLLIKLANNLKGINSIEKDAKTKIDLSNQDGLKISSKETELTFKTGELNLNNKKITGVESGLGINQINNVLSGDSSKINDIKNNVVNVKDLSDVTKALVDKGIKFGVDTGSETTIKLGDKLSIKGKEDTSNGNHRNIITEISMDNILIKLANNLKGIDSVGKDDSNKLVFEKDKATIKIGNTDLTLAKNGDKVKISGLGSGEISDTSNDTVTGSQLKSVKDVLGADLDNDKLKLQKPLFTAVESISTSKAVAQDTFKGAIDELIKAVNKGYKFGDGISNDVHYLGSTINIKAGDINTEYKSNNIITKYSKNPNGDGEIKIGFKDAPVFKNVTLDNDIKPTKDRELTTKKYVDDAIKNALSKDDAIKIYAKLDASNLSEGNKSSWRSALDVYNKAEVDAKFGGEISDNDEKAVSGKKIYAAIVGAKTKIQKDKSDNSGILEITPENENNGLLSTTYKIKINSDKLKEVAGTTHLNRDFLKITGENIGNDLNKKIFGSNVGVNKIEGNSTQLVQADAVRNYLKGTGKDSVRVSENAIAEGEGSISIGKDAEAKNESSVAIGKGTTAKNTQAVSIGANSNVLGERAISLGANNNVNGSNSASIGENNDIRKEQTFVIGNDNVIEGKKNIVVGSRVELKDAIEDAIVLGDESEGISGTVSVGKKDSQRRIIYVATPQDKYDATNKDYVDNRFIKFKGNDNSEKVLKLDNILEVDSVELTVDNNKEKEIKTKVVDSNGNAKLVLELNKSTEVKENDDRVITSGAVKKKIDEITNDLSGKLGEATIKYKANSKDERTVKLTDGFNFVDTTNIKAKAESNGKISFELNSELKNISKISSENGKPIIITSGDKTYKFGVDNDNESVITKKALDDKLNDYVTKENDKTAEVSSDKGSGIKVEKTDSGSISKYKLSLDEKKIKELAGTTNLKGDLDNVKTELTNKGIKFGANHGGEQVSKLGSLVSIKGADENKDESLFDRGKNIMTSITNNNGSNSILISLAKNLKGLDSAEFGSGDKAIRIDSTPITDKDGKQVRSINEALNKLAQNTKDLENNSVKYDDKDKTSITLSGSDGTTIKNLKAGKVSADSKEAINGSQLFESNKNIADVLGAEVEENGKVKTPSFKNKGTNYLDAINKNTDKIKENKNSIDELKNTLGNFKDKGLFKVKANNKETAIKTGDTIEFLAGKNLSVENKDGKIKYSITDKPEFSSVQLGKVVLEEHDGGLKVSNGSIKWNGDDLTSLYESKNLSNVVTVNDLQKVANGGISFSGDSGSVHKKLSNTLSIKGKVESGHQNIKTTVNEGVELALNDDIKVKNSISAGSTTLDSNKLEFGNTEFSINSDGTINGFNPNKDNAIATVGYVNKVKTGVNQGIASVAAMANIPQVNEEHGFSVGAGVGYYEGKSAIAVGISGQNMAENIVYKASVGFDGNKATLGAGFNYNINKRKPSNSKLKELEDKYNKLENYVKNLKVEEFKEKLYVIDQFENDSFNPTNSQLIKLKAIVKEINEKYSDRIIDIAGHTDTSHTDKYNLDLGLKRANKIVDKMIELGLKNPQNIRKVSSFGYNNKVNSNELSSNRRVEIYIK